MSWSRVIEDLTNVKLRGHSACSQMSAVVWSHMMYTERTLLIIVDYLLYAGVSDMHIVQVQQSRFQMVCQINLQSFESRSEVPKRLKIGPKRPSVDIMIDNPTKSVLVRTWRDNRIKRKDHRYQWNTWMRFACGNQQLPWSSHSWVRSFIARRLFLVLLHSFADVFRFWCKRVLVYKLQEDVSAMPRQFVFGQWQGRLITRRPYIYINVHKSLHVLIIYLHVLLQHNKRPAFVRKKICAVWKAAADICT